MSRPGKMFGGILLILIGASVLLSMIGINLGGMIGLAVGAWLLYWGYSSRQQKGRWSFSSVFLLVLGGLIVLGGIGGVMSLFIGAGLVYGGYRLMKTNEEDHHDDHFEPRERFGKSTYDTIDEELAKLMNEK